MKRGGVSGHKVRVARSMYAAGLLSLQSQVAEVSTPRQPTRRGRLFSQVKKLWTPKGV